MRNPLLYNEGHFSNDCPLNEDNVNKEEELQEDGDSAYFDTK